MTEWHLTDLLAALLAPPVVFMAGYNYRQIQAAGRHVHDLLAWKDTTLPHDLHETYARRDVVLADLTAIRDTLGRMESQIDQLVNRQ